MIHSVVTCDTPTCLGRYLEPDDLPEGRTIEWAMFCAGWLTSSTGKHTCPACAAGRLPVSELGECERCGGRIGTHMDGYRCHGCAHVTPYEDDLDDDFEDD